MSVCGSWKTARARVEGRTDDVGERGVDGRLVESAYDGLEVDGEVGAGDGDDDAAQVDARQRGIHQRHAVADQVREAARPRDRLVPPAATRPQWISVGTVPRREPGGAGHVTPRSEDRSMLSMSRSPALGLSPSRRTVDDVRCISFRPSARCFHARPRPIDCKSASKYETSRMPHGIWVQGAREGNRVQAI